MKHTLLKKMLVIGLLVGLLVVPLAMIQGVVYERSAYRDQASYSIAQSWTGSQNVIGPLLVVPYKVHRSEKYWDENLKRYERRQVTYERQFYIAPQKLTIDADVKTETRKRGIYAVPVYHGDFAFKGRFDPGELGELLKARDDERIELQSAYLSVVTSDVRGIESQPMLSWGGKTYEFVADAHIKGLRDGMHATVGGLTPDDDAVDFKFALSLRGMENLGFSPVGKSNTVTMKANWPSPSFMGRYLPTTRSIDEEGFTATWNVSSFSSNVPKILDTCATNSCAGLADDWFGVKLFNSVDVYQQSDRSVKYGILFILLTFVAFFLFEVMKGLRLHPMQYLLVGLDLSVFYLLLISLSEHMVFGAAYLIATLASTSLIAFYVSSVLRSIKLGGMIGVALLLLYAMLYAILGSEDNALLMGALLIFGVLSLVMVVTRRVDWYAITDSMSGLVATKRANGEETPRQS